MPTSVGPNTYGEENLVFGYDLGDVSNSYKGEPTTNLLGVFVDHYSNEEYWSRPTNNYQVEVVESYIVDPTAPGGSYTYVRGNTENTNAQIFWSAANVGLSKLDEFGQPVTVSAWLKGVGQVKLNAYDNITGYKQGSSITLTDQWTYHTFSTTFGSGSGNANHWVGVREITSGSGVIDEVYVSKLQWERNTHATPYVNGTRSATQGLLDLTGNSTIDLTNVTFDSNAQFTFDGTNDYINLGDNSLFDFTNGVMTVEAVIKFPSSWTGGSQYPNLISKGASAGWDTNGWSLFGFRSYGSGTGYTVGIGLRNSTTTRITLAYNQPTDTWLHVVGTLDGSYIKVYVNSTLQASNTQTINPGDNSTNVYIGRDPNSQYFPGDIPVTKIYSRALTAAEVQANFNAIKGRFNI